MAGSRSAYQTFEAALWLGMSVCASNYFEPWHTARYLPGDQAFAGFSRLIPPWDNRAPGDDRLAPAGSRPCQSGRAARSVNCMIEEASSGSPNAKPVTSGR